MKIRARFGLLSLTLVAFIGVLLAPISGAGERPVQVSYAGIGYDTSFDPDGDGIPVGLTLTDSQGTLGAAKLAITTAWAFGSEHPCREGYDLPFTLVFTATAYTFADQSQLFGSSADGWLCGSSTTGAYYGEEHGVYGGGTGRFEQATGKWATKFDGFTLDPTIDFRSIRGTATGTLVTR